MPETDPRPAPSAEGRRLIQDLMDAVAEGTASGVTFDRAERAALSAYVAGLETEVAASRAADAHTSGLPSGTYDQNDLRRAFKAGWAQSKLLNATAALAQLGADP